MTLTYVLKRFGIFFLIIWAASTINFVIPRLAPGDPMAGPHWPNGSTRSNRAKQRGTNWHVP